MTERVLPSLQTSGGVSDPKRRRRCSCLTQSAKGFKVSANITSGLIDDIVARLQRAVEELRSAVQDGTAVNPEAAKDLADRMERYAQDAVRDCGRPHGTDR
jgi:hypothetical protein